MKRNSQWKRCLPGLLALMLLLACLTGCGSGQKPEPTAEAEFPEEAPEPKDTVTLLVQGTAIPDSPVWDGTAYCALDRLAELAGSGLTEGDRLSFDAWGCQVSLGRRNGSLSVNGEPVSPEATCRYWKDAWYVPAEPLLTACGMRCLPDPEEDQIFFTRVPLYEQVPTGRDVVVLRYHCVSDDIWGGESLFMSPEKLEEQICAMEEMGCSFLTFEDLPQLDRYEKPVLLTFDDGYGDNYDELFPILRRHNAKATVFVITAMIGTPHHLTPEQIREMDASGLVSIQSHTVSHENLSALTEEEQEYQLSASRLALARVTGKIPFALSYPRAKASAEVLGRAAAYYDYCVLRNGFPYETGTDPYEIPRFAMPRDIDMDAFLSYFECFREADSDD